MPQAPDDGEPDVIVERQSSLFHHDWNEDDDNNQLEDHYAIGKLFGTGQGIRICRHKLLGHKRALKTLAKANVSPEKFRAEIAALRTVDHPNLLKLYESFEDAHHYYIITELSTAGNLYDYLAQNFSELDETHMARLMKQILICVNHCHALNIVHCDIKPENILMEKGDPTYERLILADFGFAQFYDPETRMKLIRGTPSYWSPQVFRQSYGPKTDLWSCGILAFVLMTGQFPFQGTSANPVENAKEIYQQIKTRTDHFDLEIWQGRSQEGKRFVQDLLTIDETERPTAQEALRYPWFDLMKQVEEEGSPVKVVAAQTRPALEKLLEFSAQQKLKQAVYAYLVAHQTLKSRKKIIDRIFRQVDANSDGLICQSEIENAFHRDKGKLLTAEELADIFERVDIDKSGYINYWEFLAATTRADAMLCQENLRIAFETFDTNKNGTISAEEVKKLFANQQRFKGDEKDDDESSMDDDIVAAIIQQVDENGDGEINFEEFSNMMTANLMPSSKRSSDQSSESEREENAPQRQRSC